jgi:uncharacterized membrane protein YbhN (UPF0104 family)
MSFFSIGISSVIPLFVMFSVSWMIGILSFLPGGRGVIELSATAIAATLYNYPPEVTVPALVQLIIIGYAGNFLAYVLSKLLVD